MTGLSRDVKKIYGGVKDIYGTSRISLRLFLSDLSGGEICGDTSSRTICLKAEPLGLSVGMSLRYANGDERKILECLKDYLDAMVNVSKNSESTYMEKNKTACKLLILDKKYGFDSIRTRAFDSTIDGEISLEYLKIVKEILSDINTSYDCKALPEKSMDVSGING